MLTVLKAAAVVQLKLRLLSKNIKEQVIVL
jgi:hypothetical protein